MGKTVWTKETLRTKLFQLLADGKKVNPQSVEDIEHFYRDAKKLHGTYENFLIDNGLNPAFHFHRNRHLNTIKSTAGLLFEELLGDLLRELGRPIICETVNGHRPDYIERTSTSEIWIDAKLSEHVALASNTAAKYAGKCDKLFLIYLIGENKDYHTATDVRIISVRAFLSRLAPHREAVYEKRLKLIEKIAVTTDKEIQDFGEVG